ncbi:hypothetical protein Q7P37_000923 [Cladosporium fusiforme]
MLETPIREHTFTTTSSTPAAPRASQSLPEPFVFVPITGAEAAKGRGAAKQIVRAHVTRVQHSKSSTLSYTQNLEPWTVKPHVHRTQPARPQNQTQILETETSRKKSTDNRKRSKKAAATAAAAAAAAASSSSADANSEDVEEIVRRQPPAVTQVPRLPAAKRVGAARQDPFWSYPVEYQPYLPAIFAHYIENVAVEIPDLDSPNHKGLLRRRWFPLAMEEPSTMYAVLLMAASHYCAINPHSSNLIDLLYLKSRALNEINSALRDPKRATSDAIIGAVMKMAAYEACFGDSAVFSQHMKGLSLMLKMRGGLGTLGLDGLLERMVVWIDLNASVICGLSKLFGNEAFPTQVFFEQPDLYHFAGIQ